MNNTTTSSHFSVAAATGVVFMVALAVSIVLFVALLICSCMRTSSILRRSASAEEHGGDSIQSDGLDAAAISAFPIYIYAETKGADPTAACCTICLVDFVDGKAVRVLPECCHVFHRSCIDPWLMRISTCPICRHQPLSAAAAARFAAPLADQSAVC